MANYDIGYLFGSLVGGLIAAVVLTRLIRVILGTNKFKPPYFIATYAIALVIAVVIGGFGFADSGQPPVFGDAFRTYVFPMLAVMAFDVFRLRSKARKGSAGPQKTPH